MYFTQLWYLEEGAEEAEYDICSIQLHTQDESLDTGQVLEEIKVTFETLPLDVFQSS